jgi:hypothetical protein
LSDIFREVEEDVRRDKLEKFWKTNGGTVIALIFAGLLAVAGWEAWQYYEAGQRQKDFTAYTAALSQNDPKAAAKAFADLAQHAGAGYVTLAKMGQANALLQSGNRAQAVTLYKDIANSDTGPMGAAARIRAGWALADSPARSELQSLLQPVLDPGSAWKQVAQEILAYNDYRNGKVLVASSEFKKIADDTTAPDALRDRARAFAAFLTGGGATNAGTVPPLAPPAPQDGAAAAAAGAAAP